MTDAPAQASNVQELTAAIFQRKSLMAAIDPAMGKYLTVSVAYRGKLSMRDSGFLSPLLAQF